MIKAYLLTLFAVFFMIGCKSAPTKVADLTEGEWRAKALIKDKAQDRSYIVNLNFNAVKDERARMDVTSTLGTGVASLVITPQEIRYVLLDQKKYYVGPPQPDAMKPILSMPFDARWIHNLLFDEPIPDKSWTCTRSAEGWLESCKEAATGTSITWSGRHGDKKTVVIDHPKASVQINVQSYKPKVEDRKNLFVLEAPEGYQKLKIK